MILRVLFHRMWALPWHALRAGENTLSFTITGAHPKAKKSYMIGLDYLLLPPAK